MKVINISSSVQTSGGSNIADRNVLHSFPATQKAGYFAMKEARISFSDLSLVELHDCFSIAEILNIEDLGLIPSGEAASWCVEGRTKTDGDLPVNPSGGLLSKGHPVGATGLGQIYEACKQLRAEHENQVKGAKTALTHNLGGCGIACTVNVLEI